MSMIAQDLLGIYDMCDMYGTFQDAFVIAGFTNQSRRENLQIMWPKSKDAQTEWLHLIRFRVLCF